MVERPDGVHGAQGQENRRREVQGLFRFQRAAAQAAVASHSGDVPRREGRDPRSADAARGGGRGRRRAAQFLRTEDHAAFCDLRPGPPRRPLAGGNRAVGVAYQDPGPSRHRPADAAVDRGRDGSRARVRLESARPAAGGAGRRARDHGSRSRLPLRRQGRRRRRHRQGGGHHGGLSARTAAAAGTRRWRRSANSPWRIASI